MARSQLVGALFALLLVAVAGPAAAQVELQNDGFQTGDVAGAQGGFVAGEQWGVKFQASAGDYPLAITKLTLLYGGSTATQTTTVHIKAADGTSALGASGFPGTELYTSGEYQMTGSDSAFNEIDVSGEGWVINSGPFWVVFDVTHASYPSIMRDNDGSITPGVNAINAEGLGWADSQLLGLTGDWILRATVVPSGSNPTDITSEPEDTAPADTTTANDTSTADTSSPNDTSTSPDVTEPETLTITAINPNSAPAGQSALVQVLGTGFADGITLRMGVTPLEGVVVASPTILNATVPDTLAVGVYDVIAQNTDGTTYTFPSGFEITDGGTVTAPPPAIATVQPVEGGPGTAVTVTGANFQDGMTLSFGGAEVNAAVFPAQQEAVFSVPSDAQPGVYSITVANPDGQSDTASNIFTVPGGGSGGDDGCGCQVRRSSGGSGAALVFMALLGVALVVRRRS